MTIEQIKSAEAALLDDKTGTMHTNSKTAIEVARQACATIDNHGMMEYQSALVQAWWANHNQSAEAQFQS